jgi:hypothetical protein
MRPFNWIKIILSLFLVCFFKQVISQTIPEGFKLEIVDPQHPLLSTYLPYSEGENVGWDIKYNHKYVIDKNTGVLTLHIPNHYFINSSVTISLQFLEGRHTHYFFRPLDHKVTVYNPQKDNAWYDIIFTPEDYSTPRISYLSKPISDSLQFVRIVIQKSMASVKGSNFDPAADPSKQEYQMITELAKDYRINPYLKGYADKLKTYLLHKKLLNSWQDIDTSFTSLPYFKSPNAFYEASLLQDHKTSIQTLADSVKSSSDKDKTSTGLLTLSNTKTLLNFLNQPESDNGLLPDLKVFYLAAGNMMAQKTGIVTLHDVPQFRPVVIKDTANQPISGNKPDSFYYSVTLTKYTSKILKNIAISNSAAKDFFPETFNFSKASTNVADVGHLETSLRLDFANFPERFTQWVARVEQKPTDKYLLALEDLKQVYRDMGADSLNLLKSNRKVNTSLNNIDLVKLLSLNLRDTSNQRYYITPMEYAHLQGTGQIYFTSLLYKQAPTLFDRIATLRKSELNLVSHLKSADSNAHTNQLLSIARRIGDMVDYLQQYESGKNATTDFKQHAQLLNDLYFNSYQIFYHDGNLSEKNLDDLERFSSNMIDLFESSKENAPFLRADTIVKLFMPFVAERFDQLRKQKDFHRVDSLVSAVNQVSNYYETYSYLKNFPDPKQMNEVIEAIFLPPSLLAEVRNSPLSIIFGAKPGVYYSKYPWGFTLPIGIDVAAGLKKPFRRNTAFSFDNYYKQYFENRYNGGYVFFNLQVLDIADPFSFRHNAPYDESSASRITISKVFAPGASIGYGFPHSPFVMDGGFRYDETATGKRIIFPCISFAINMPLSSITSETKR